MVTRQTGYPPKTGTLPTRTTKVLEKGIYNVYQGIRKQGRNTREKTGRASSSSSSSLAVLFEGAMASAWVRVVGVVGGGQMGSGIAQLAAAAQLDVILADVDQQALQRGMRNITSSLSKFVKKQALSQVRTRTRTRTRTKIDSGFHQNSQFTKAHSKISKSCNNDFLSILFYAIRNPVCPSVSGFCGIKG